ncbi:hypothetical protein R1A27_20130 [Methylobacterium sp. NMS12]|uniref:hypothetical protein n=1 Tax=Methylobacterium sp. NMS12 TaxID=3079766 RepID=UPI003F882E83
MRKLILAPMALACLIVSAAAQQAPSSTVDQGRAGAAPWPVSWSGQSVLADLRVAGSAVSTGNPVPTSITNFPATQTIAGSVTANIGTTNGLGLDSSLQLIRTALGSPLQAGGSVGISGTLPPFASVQTFNLGTLNGAATAANQASEISQLTTIATKAVFYADLSTATTGTNPYNGPVHDLGTAPAFSRISAGGNSTQTGTVNLLGCYDSACGGTFVMASYTVPAGGGNMAISATVITRYWRAQFVNGGTNGAANVYASATAN